MHDLTLNVRSLRSLRLFIFLILFFHHLNMSTLSCITFLIYLGSLNSSKSFSVCTRFSILLIIFSTPPKYEKCQPPFLITFLLNLNFKIYNQERP